MTLVGKWISVLALLVLFLHQFRALVQVSANQGTRRYLTASGNEDNSTAGDALQVPTSYPTSKLVPTSSPKETASPTPSNSTTTTDTSNSTNVPTASPAVSRPNILLVIADDLGYYDIGANGNKVVQTPYLDKLRVNSVRLEDFHMYPTCAPSRVSLLSGRYATRAGVWHTIMSRNIMNPNEVLLQEILSQNGYSTALIGKWHLGDNYPSRASDKGFQTIYGFPGGGIGQTPDYWKNTNFNPTLLIEGQDEPTTGFSTDVLFGHAIELVNTMKEPFFIYLATNAAHAPQNAPPQDLQRYINVPEASQFYGMITNLDRNVERLDDALRAAGKRDNTIFIFTSDNGSACGPDRCPWSSRGFSGFKSSVYEGGHKVPFFLRWPSAGLVSGVVNDVLMSIDVFPTLLDLSNIEYTPTESHELDGKSFKKLLFQGTSASDDDNELSQLHLQLSQRMLVIEDQRILEPEKWRATVVLYGKWRYIKPQLFDISDDPYQEKNVAPNRKDIVDLLKNFYDKYWEEMSTKYFNINPYIAIGSPYENPVNLNAMDWVCSSYSPWDQPMIINEEGAKFGFWRVKIMQSGTYQITARKFPKESGRSINSGKTKVDTAIFVYNGVTYKQKVIGNQDSVVFENIYLNAGDEKLFVNFYYQGVSVMNAYYVTVKHFTQSPTTFMPTTPSPSKSPFTASPTEKPTTYKPTSVPTTSSPTTPKPTQTPTTSLPTTSPTLKPTHTPTTPKPTTLSPTRLPTTPKPTTYKPTTVPTTSSPTTRAPTLKPTTRAPTLKPTRLPTDLEETQAPTTTKPTQNPTNFIGRLKPTREPTQRPSTKHPTTKPTRRPTENPTASDGTSKPTRVPTKRPTNKAPTVRPTRRPSQNPTKLVTTLKPTLSPHPPTAKSPTQKPITKAPTTKPTKPTTKQPTMTPTTASPVISSPTYVPTTVKPTTLKPTTRSPTTRRPSTLKPTRSPKTRKPTSTPVFSQAPTKSPSKTQSDV